jgi:multidrug transporter EmrE-like cation transporter
MEDSFSTMREGATAQQLRTADGSERKVGVKTYSGFLSVLSRAMTYFYLAVAICAEVAATTFLKLSDGFSKPLPSVLSVVGYGISFYFLSIALRSIPTGIAYAIWSGFGIILITLTAWIFQGQKLDTAAVGGMSLILAGVLVMNLLSKSASH